MVDETEQKIMDAALKIFAEKGYNGATTRAISIAADINDSTLFRIFGTKKNLFDQVLIQNNEKMMKSLDSVIIHKEFDTNRDFLETLIRNLVKLAEDNYEHLNLTINEGSRISENVMDKFIFHLSKYMEENIKESKMNYPVFVMTITSFIYLLIHDKHQGRTTVNHDEVVEAFINNTSCCIP